MRGGSCPAALFVRANEGHSAKLEESWLFYLPKGHMVYQNIMLKRLNIGVIVFGTLGRNYQYLF